MASWKKKVSPKPYLRMVAERGEVLAAPVSGSLKVDLLKDKNTCVKIGRKMITKHEVKL